MDLFLLPCSVDSPCWYRRTYLSEFKRQEVLLNIYNSFDVVISINTVHNLDKGDCGKALREISRVSKKHSYITVDAYRTEQEKIRMFEWNLTAKTILSVNEWKNFFYENNYDGDYFWFIP